MEFDKNKVYTAANADSLRTGSIGYHADNLEALKRRVSREVNEEYGMLTEILDEGCSYRFRINDIIDKALFYLVEEPKKEEFHSYNDVKDLVTICRAYDVNEFTLYELFDHFTYLDGSPCGIKED